MGTGRGFSVSYTTLRIKALFNVDGVEMFFGQPIVVLVLFVLTEVQLSQIYIVRPKTYANRESMISSQICSYNLSDGKRYLELTDHTNMMCVFIPSSGDQRQASLLDAFYMYSMKDASCRQSSSFGSKARNLWEKATGCWKVFNTS